VVKTWSKDDPKAGLMERKRSLIVGAALEAFIEEGYAGSSVNRIAAAAGVSIKTWYRHFKNKDELFSAVMEAACEAAPELEEAVSILNDLPPEQGIAIAGEAYLHHALRPEQLGLYRVVIRDAPRFPELGARYEAEVINRRISVFAEYLTRWARALDWPPCDGAEATRMFAALLTTGIVDKALQGTPCQARKSCGTTPGVPRIG